MKPILAVLLVFSIALPAGAHPGKTDRHGGHKCYKECAEWDLYYAEYHLHDKNGRPVKVVKKKPIRSAPTVTAAEGTALVEQLPPVSAAAAVPPVVQAAIVPEETGLPLIWVLLALFLLLLLLVRRRRAERTEGQ